MAIKPILLIGGYGVTGRKTALQLRARHPDVPLAIAGRDIAKARALAAELGNAQGYFADLLGVSPNLGLPHGEFSAVVTFLMDNTGSALDFARANRIPAVIVTGGAFELGQQVVMAGQAAREVPVIVAGNWFCGTALMPILDLCSEFQQVDRVKVGIVIDRNGSKAGPATYADFERILAACATMPQRTGGHYEWVKADAGRRTYTGTGGRPLEGTPSVSIDAVTVAAVTGARDVTVLETWGDSLSSSTGGPASDEIVIEASGLDADGTALLRRREVVARRDTSPFTAIGIALLLGRAAALDGPALAPGVLMVEQVLDPRETCAAMAAAGVDFGPVTATING